MHDLTNSIVPQSSSALTEASSDDFFINFGLKCLFLNVALELAAYTKVQHHFFNEFTRVDRGVFNLTARVEKLLFPSCY